jgi:uncharacterized protein YneF (UPF0154 family)
MWITIVIVFVFFFLGIFIGLWIGSEYARDEFINLIKFNNIKFTKEDN